MTAIDDAYARAGIEIAHRIRAELVCCDVYAQGIPPGLTKGHAICYWGEVSARIAENAAATAVVGPEVSSGTYAYAVGVLEARGYDRGLKFLRDEAARWAPDAENISASRTMWAAYETAADLLEFVREDT